MAIGFTPQATISCNGVNVTGNLSDRLVSITVHDESGFKNDRVEIQLDDRENLAMPPDKATISVAIGYLETGLVDKGSWVFDEGRRTSPPRTLHITAHAFDTGSAFKTNRDQSYHNTTIGDIVSTIAGRNNLTANVVGDMAGVKIPHRDQTAHSDMAFLTHLADEYNGVMKVIGGQLVLAPRGLTKTSSGTAVTNTTIDITMCTEFDYKHQSRGQYDAASVVYPDQDTGKLIKATVSASGTAGVGAAAAVHVQAFHATTAQEAQYGAASNFNKAHRNVDTFTFSCPGIPEVAAEGLITLTGFPPDVPTSWMVSQCTHTYASDAYSLQCYCELPGQGVSAGQASASDEADTDSTDADGQDGTQSDGVTEGDN